MDGLSRERHAEQESNAHLEQGEGGNGDDLSVSSAFQEGRAQQIRAPTVGVDTMKHSDNIELDNVD